MKCLKQDAINLNHKIKELEEIKQYLQYKKWIQEDELIQSWLKQIQEIQKKMNQKLKENRIQEYYQLKKELEAYKHQFDIHPLIQNYLRYKQDTYDIIQEITNVLYWE